MAEMRRLLVLLFAALGPAIALAGAQSSGIEPASFDRSVRPQDDLFRYVNGRWLATAEIAGDRVAYGTFAELADRAESDVRETIERAASAPRRRQPAAVRQIGDLYASITDEARLAALGYAPIKPELDRIAAIRTPEQLARETGYLSATAQGGPFAGTIMADPGYPGARIVQVVQGGTLLPDRDYYLSSDPKYAAIRAQYETYLTTIFTLTGWTDPPGKARAVLGLEIELARAQTLQSERAPAVPPGVLTLAELVTTMPGFDWAAWAKPQGLERARRLILQPPSFFRRFAELAVSEPVSTWRAWLAARYITSSAPSLSQPFNDARFEFFGRVLSGQELPRTRWKRGVSLVNGYLGDEVGRLYVEAHFPPSSKARVEAIVGHLRAAFRRAIEDSDWMSGGTKRAAIDKLARMSIQVGYPDVWQDYRALDIKRDDLFGNIQRAQAFQNEQRMRRLAGLADPREWLMPPQSVNAYYVPSRNSIALPAAVLQPPLFDAAADDAVNYGGIGAVLGHEIGHAFDEQGRRTDGFGRVRDWWTSADAEQFARRADRLVEQFNAFTPLEGLHVNGALTRSENVGDLVGLSIAYRAYALSLGGRPSSVLDGFTGEQRFFLSWARVWRGKERDEYLRQTLFANQHAPFQYRANGPLAHLQGFYDAFGVRPGDRLYRDPAARVTIW